MTVLAGLLTVEEIGPGPVFRGRRVDAPAMALRLALPVAELWPSVAVPGASGPAIEGEASEASEPELVTLRVVASGPVRPLGVS
jgi:hypothetical protein